MYKVLFLGWEYYPVFTGGLGVVCEAMAEEFTLQGLEVLVALPQVPKKISVSKVNFAQMELRNNVDYVESIYKNKLKYKQIDIELDPYGSYTKTNYKTNSVFNKYLTTVEHSINNEENSELYGENLFQKIEIYKQKVLNSLVDMEFDVIHAHDWMTYMAAIEAKEISGKKCILHVHATELDRTAGNPHELIFDIEKEMLKKADIVVAISNQTKNTLVQEYNIDPSKIRVIHNALAEKHYSVVKKNRKFGGSKTVMFLGRAVVQKGVEHFIYIAEKVLQVLPDTTFVFAGDGEKLTEAIELVNKLKISENFIFTGAVDRLQSDELFYSADLYLMTSISEPFGLTALESIHHGTPVIVTKTSGVSEVIPNALVADFWDIDKFADYVINILLSDELYNELKKNQMNDLKKISWKNQVEKLIEIYHTLVEKN